MKLSKNHPKPFISLVLVLVEKFLATKQITNPGIGFVCLFRNLVSAKKVLALKLNPFFGLTL